MANVALIVVDVAGIPVSVAAILVNVVADRPALGTVGAVVFVALPEPRTVVANISIVGVPIPYVVSHIPPVRLSIRRGWCAC